MTNYLNFIKNESSINNLLLKEVKEKGISKIILENLKDIEETEILEQKDSFIKKWNYFNNDLLESLILTNNFTEENWENYLFFNMETNFDLILKYKNKIPLSVIYIICESLDCGIFEQYSLEYEENFLLEFYNEINECHGYIFFENSQKYTDTFKEKFEL